MRKRARGHVVDKLNLNCLCGWPIRQRRALSSANVRNILRDTKGILDAWEGSSSLETGFVRLARHLGPSLRRKVDDVIWLYLETCLLILYKLANPWVRFLTPGP
ncbi:hypothetical protein L208DRAFT_428036 [Tricholoma matsutake]|nr:hypothetical protein L208DRAFT_428036 [Tricholoma matsutake 945]